MAASVVRNGTPRLTPECVWETVCLRVPGRRIATQMHRGFSISATLQIPLRNGGVATIDAADLPIVEAYSWASVLRGSPGNAIWYAGAQGTPRGKLILMHRLILGLTSRSQQCDHISGDGLDNRRANLRTATNSQNQMNRRKAPIHGGKPPSSRYKGVYRDRVRKRWRAILRVDGKRRNLGRFQNEMDAARAYDEAARRVFGDFARLNFE